MKAPHELTLTEASFAIRNRSLSPVDLTQAMLERIERLEPTIRAWEALAPSFAMETARIREREVNDGKILGPLHGIPLGVKDVFNVAGMVTACGASSFAHVHPVSDSAIVELLRRSGAVILGKTKTTQFAFLDPTDTRNPWNVEHTPGGSSSGSAAAVAARMIPAAFGTQSVGSVLRPAAYCGVVGLKPTYGRISFRGVMPVSWSLDHVGFFARNVRDAALVLSIVAGYDSEDPYSIKEPVPDYCSELEKMQPTPRFGIPKVYLEKSSHEVATHIQQTAELLSSAGASLEVIDLPESYNDIHAAGGKIMRAEAAAYHEIQFEKHSAEYRPKVRAMIQEGLLLKGSEIARAEARRVRFKRDISRLLESYDALLMSVAETTAPKGLSSTGDGSFCAPWTFAGVPAITIPAGFSGDGLPIGIQIVASPWSELRLLAVAFWCEQVLSINSSPVL